LTGFDVYWEEDKTKDAAFVVPDDVVDVAFRIRARSLPLDHAHALSEALHAALPWLTEDPAAGVHLIHGAESGNGWYRRRILKTRCCVRRGVPA